MSDPQKDRLVADLEILAELFRSGGWSEVRIDSEPVSLLLSNDRTTPGLGRPRIVAAPASAAALSEAAPATVEARPPAEPTAPPMSSGAIDPNWSAVVAPNLGTFYRSPKPGAPNFVEVGQRVDAKTEICLIEVMKLFTSVQAGVAGTVRHIAVADAELVQGGQVLIYIQRD